MTFTLLDGGMGKLLLARGAPFRQPEWSALALMEGPEHVVAAHREFIDAGADVIITNNYAVVPYHLGGNRFAADAEELVGLAGALARQAADSADRLVRVAGSLPPLFGSYEPDDFDAEQAPGMLALIAGALAPHIDFFLTETQSVLAEAQASATAAAPYGKPLWMGVSLSDIQSTEGVSTLRSGESVRAAAELAAVMQAEALLFNCSEPEVMEAAVVEARAVLPSEMQIGVYANAFKAKSEGYSANDTVLDHRSDLNDGGYTEFVQRWLDAGADIVGGCCGIMPEHIARLNALR
jgi:S-methylmethionine-dependent homocysteine/selenocysteine methylase